MQLVGDEIISEASEQKVVQVIASGCAPRLRRRYIAANQTIGDDERDGPNEQDDRKVVDRPAYVVRHGFTVSRLSFATSAPCTRHRCFSGRPAVCYRGVYACQSANLDYPSGV